MAEITKTDRIKTKLNDNKDHSLEYLLGDFTEKRFVGGAKLNKSEELYFEDALGKGGFAHMKSLGLVGPLWECVKDRRPKTANEILIEFKRVAETFLEIKDHKEMEATARSETIGFSAAVRRYEDDGAAVGVANWIANAAKEGGRYHGLTELMEKVFNDDLVAKAINKLGKDSGQAAFRVGKAAHDVAIVKHIESVGELMNDVLDRLKD